MSTTERVKPTASDLKKAWDEMIRRDKEQPYQPVVYFIPRSLYNQRSSWPDNVKPGLLSFRDYFKLVNFKNRLGKKYQSKHRNRVRISNNVL